LLGMAQVLLTIRRKCSKTQIHTRKFIRYPWVVLDQNQSSKALHS
jgi:hypothetical protein